MRVLVTGAAGFVGGHLMPLLRDAGFEVRGIDREVDVTDPSAIGAALRETRPDSIVHLAAQSSVAASWKHPLTAFRLNYLGSLQVLSAAAEEVPDARVLLIGSSDTYGSGSGGDGSDGDRSDRPIHEDAPMRPQSPYARSKAAAELLGALLADGGRDILRVRAFTHIGPGQSDVFVASSFGRQVAEIEAGMREPLLRVGNLDSVRDFLDVRDVVDAYVRLLDPSVPAGTYNVASGRGVSIRSLLDELLDLAGVQAEIEVDPDLYRATDFRIGDASRLRAATDWEPRIPLRETLARVLEWWRGQLRAPAG